MENKGLLFIPDISGFTRFVNETEIEHSRLIIQELLGILIDSNQSGLEVSEIEGDAILFYKFGESPDLKELYKQVEKMFCAFHRNLTAYDYRRFCQCKACTSALNLTLKIITHYGEFTDYKVMNFKKLIGRDVIVAHQLLKNDIAQHEYWLVTKSLLHNHPPVNLANWMRWSSSAKQTENGEVPFHYTQLGKLKNEITPDLLPNLQIEKKLKVFSLTEEYNTDIITLFHTTGDFNYKSLWQVGIKTVEEVNHFLPRVGMRCRYVMENGQTVIYSSSYSYRDDHIEFSETDDKKKNSTYYLLERLGEKSTRLTIILYIRKNFPEQLLYKLIKKKKKQAELHESMLKLKEVVKEIYLEDLSV